ncbi:hypothetical protein DFA_00036 [Cavenderia fasciculata]|uniref:Late endosomal/lysosomal adaptor and MAPK and MTOR activator 5 n=1 Tax=Cavenderia fasciculata TaxID=261658 RepID=F4PXE9_CACFS|nr:uncharacterized protein DFA_00036 [Cavenderia fasciculata]EGG19459.1 hypothetical protein DFA_00036 [Cavenderia fasciculata]|eukprot:XP_004357753.1 hypothetical protein DFA_00036 [Cavenderia fasciculata]
MSSELNNFCQKIIQRFQGSSIVIADKDGFVLAKAIDHDTMEEKVIDSSFLSTFSLASDQAGKLLFGKNKSIVSYFDDKLVFQINVQNIITNIPQRQHLAPPDI